MGAVHIRIRHDNNLVIPKLRNIKVISISFGEAASKRINHRLNLRVRQNLVDTCLLHIENLSPDRQNSLVHPFSCRLGRAARRISLNNEDLTFLRIPALTVGKLPIAVKGILLLGKKIGLCFFFGLSDLRRLLRTGKHFFQNVQIPVKIAYNLVVCHLAGCFGRILIVKLCLRLPLKSWIRVLDRNNGGHTITDVGSGEIGVFFLQHADFPCVLVHHRSKRRLKPGQMCAALRIVYIVTEAKDILMEFVDVLENCFYFDSLGLALKIHRVMNGLTFGI